jgi:putative endonuclease
MTFSVYIVRCDDGTLYTGLARDVLRRIDEHNGLTPTGTRSKRGAAYTSARRPVALVYAVTLDSRSAAAKEEARLKRLSRPAKLALIAAAGECHDQGPSHGSTA